jgi:hypothetical protein
MQSTWSEICGKYSLSMETTTTQVSIKKYPSGILIEEDKGTWILSPSGNIHLTDKYDERVPTPGPLEISRSR